MFPIEPAPEALRGWRDCADAAPDELSMACVLITAPPEPFVPPELQDNLVLAMAALYVGDPEPGASVVQPLKDLGPAVDLVGPMPYIAFQAALDGTAPWGLPFYARGEYMRELPDAALDTLLDQGVRLLGHTHPLSQVVMFRIGQGSRRYPMRPRPSRTATRPICCTPSWAGAIRAMPSQRSPPPARSRGQCVPTAPARPTSTSRPRPTASATAIARTSTRVSWGSRTGLTPPTCSGSTQTSAPATARRRPRSRESPPLERHKTATETPIHPDSKERLTCTCLEHGPDEWLVRCPAVRARSD